MILAHQEIVLLHEQGHPIFYPFIPEKTVHEDTGTSYGCGACGYDVRLAEDVMMWPGRFALSYTIEHFTMPDWLTAFVTDKSSLIRMGIQVGNTKIDPGWRGHLTLELVNHGADQVLLLKGQPIAEITLNRLMHPTDRPYNGKYQDQPAMPVEAIFDRTLTSAASAVGSTPTSETLSSVSGGVRDAFLQAFSGK